MANPSTASVDAQVDTTKKVIDNEKLQAIEQTQTLDAQKQVDSVSEAAGNILNVLGVENDTLVHLPIVQVSLVILVTTIIVFLVRYIGGRLTKACAKKAQIERSHAIVNRMKFVLTWTIVTLGLNLLFFILLPREIFHLLIRISHSILLIFWITTFVFIGRNILCYFAEKHAHSSRLVQQESLPLWQNTLTILGIGATIYFIMSSWGINMSALLASAGILGIAIGFAAKDTLANLISGVFIIADRPYRMGDYVVLDTGERGKITHIGLRSTRMLTRDDIEITIPNSIMGNTMVTNQSGGGKKSMRVRVKVTVEYKTDTSKVRRLLLESVKNNLDILNSPIPRVRLRGFTPLGLDFELLCWIKSPDLRGKALDEIYEEIYDSFGRNHIEIPYNKMEVIMKDKLISAEPKKLHSPSSAVINNNVHNNMEMKEPATAINK